MDQLSQSQAQIIKELMDGVIHHTEPVNKLIQSTIYTATKIATEAVIAGGAKAAAAGIGKFVVAKTVAGGAAKAGTIALAGSVATAATVVIVVTVAVAIAVSAYYAYNIYQDKTFFSFCKLSSRLNLSLPRILSLPIFFLSNFCAIFRQIINLLSYFAISSLENRICSLIYILPELEERNECKISRKFSPAAHSTG